jgi:ribosome modulation factor
VLRKDSVPQAWVEGYLAYRRGDPRLTCPYPQGVETSDLWQAGWALAFAHDAGPLSETEHHFRHVLDKHIPDRDAWPSRGFRPGPPPP